MSEYHKLADNSEQVKTIDWQNYGLKEMVLRALKDDIPLYFRASYCGAHNGMFIFDPYGELYTCWEVVGVDKFKVGSYTNGLKFNDDEYFNSFEIEEKHKLYSVSFDLQDMEDIAKGKSAMAKNCSAVYCFKNENNRNIIQKLGKSQDCF